MHSRMDKYQTSKDVLYKRTKKNSQLYEDVYDDIYRNTSYENMSIIDSAKEIDFGKLKNIIDDKYDTRKYRTLENYQKIDDSEEIELNNDNKEKIYDINEIINAAKTKRTFLEEAKEKQKFASYLEKNKEYDEKYENLQNEEKELEELINTITMKPIKDETEDALDLFDLKGDDNTIVTNPIDTDINTNTIDKEEIVQTSNNLEKTLASQDKTFYSDSNMFTKNDFEDFNTLSRELQTSSKRKHIVIIVIIILILIAISLLLYAKFVLKKW